MTNTRIRKLCKRNKRKAPSPPKEDRKHPENNAGRGVAFVLLCSEVGGWMVARRKAFIETIWRHIVLSVRFVIYYL